MKAISTMFLLIVGLTSTGQLSLQPLVFGTLGFAFSDNLSSEEMGFHLTSEYERKEEILRYIQSDEYEGRRRLKRSRPTWYGVQFGFLTSKRPDSKWTLGISARVGSLMQEESVTVDKDENAVSSEYLYSTHNYQGLYGGVECMVSRALLAKKRLGLNLAFGAGYQLLLHSSAFVSITKWSSVTIQGRRSYDASSEQSSFLSMPLNLVLNYRLNNSLSAVTQVGVVGTQFLNFTALPSLILTPNIALGVAFTI